MDDIEKYVDETYLWPYTDPDRIEDVNDIHILPVYGVNDMMNRKYASKALANACRGKTEYLRYPKVSCVRQNKLPGYIDNHDVRRAPLMSRVAIRFQGKWIDEKGRDSDDIYLMRLSQARDVTKIATTFDYVIVGWHVLFFPPFLLSEEAFNKTPVESIIETEITTQHVAVSRIVNLMVGNDFTPRIS